MASSTESILQERGATHGDYEVQARIAQDIKKAMRSGPAWPTMSPAQQDSLEMLAVKISRACTGNPDFLDHWDDLAGYATLVAKILRKAGSFAQRPVDRV